MEVYILIEHTEQGDYTEPRHYSSASPAAEIIGVYSTYLQAEEEKTRLEKLLASDTDTDPEDEGAIYYDIETHTVE